MEDRNANIIARFCIYHQSHYLHHRCQHPFESTEPFFLILGACVAAILAVIVFYFIRRRFQRRRRNLETIIASEGKELRIEYSFLRKVAGLPTKFRSKELEEATDNWKCMIEEATSSKRIHHRTPKTGRTLGRETPIRRCHRRSERD